MKLVNVVDKMTHRYVYVPNGHTFTLTGIGPGRRLLRFALGEDWDPALKRFSRDRSYAKFDDELTFQELQVDDGTRYTVFQVTLQPIRDGNARTSPMGEDEFEE